MRKRLLCVLLAALCLLTACQKAPEPVEQPVKISAARFKF